MRCALALAVGLVVVAASVAEASAANLPNGTYNCIMTVGSSLMSVGDMEISGTSYRGPAFDRQFEGTFDYELTPQGVILWKGPLEGFSSGGNSVAATVVSRNDAGGTTFTITVKSQAGNFHSVECDRAK